MGWSSTSLSTSWGGLPKNVFASVRLASGVLGFFVRLFVLTVKASQRLSPDSNES